MTAKLLQKERIAEAKKVIDALPYRSFLSDAQIDLWINHVLAIDPERLVWQAKRLMGFGGSEMGSLVASYLSDHGSDYIKPGFSFKSANEIIQSKLMLSMPEEIAANAQRGLFFEDKIREIYINQLRAAGHSVVRDIEGMNAINNFNDPERPWRKANIDDLLIVDNCHLVADYKFPAPDIASNYNLYGVSSDYMCQGHHYSDIAQELGIDVKEACLAPYQMTEHVVYDIRYPIRADIKAACKAAGDFYWNDYLLKGKTPPFPRSWETMFDPKALTKQHKQISREYAICTSMARQVKERTEAIKQDLVTSFSDYKWEKNTKIELGPVDCFVRLEKDFSEKNILAYFKQFGMDESLFVKSRSIKYDLPAMFEQLTTVDLPDEAKQLMLSTCATDDVTFSPALTRATKTQGSRILTGLHEATSSEFSEMAERLDDRLTTIETLWVNEAVERKDKFDTYNPAGQKKGREEKESNQEVTETLPAAIESPVITEPSSDQRMQEMPVSEAIQRLKMSF